MTRFAWVVGIALVVFELLYVAAANTILRTRSLDRWVTGATEGLFLKVESGWTVWPGRMHVKGVELRFEDYNVQFSVALDEATVDIVLWQLPAKIFHLTRVRAHGVRYLFRHKVESAEGMERRLALYPKIPGYADPPMFVGENTPPLTDDEYDLWTIHIEDVDAEARELWFLEHRFTGKARARGGFRLEPERDAQTDRCTLWLDGALHIGDVAVASKLKGWLHAQLDRHDPRVVEGAAVFEKISLNTKLLAEVPSLEFAKFYQIPDGIALSRGGGSLHVRAQLEHGAWMENTALRYETTGATAAQQPWVVTGPVLLAADIVKGGRDSQLEIVATSEQLRLSNRASPKEIDEPKARKVRVRLGTTANLAQPIEARSFHARLNAQVPQLRWLNAVLESEDLFRHGSTDGDLEFNWAQGRFGGAKIALDAKEARFAVAGKLIQVSGDIDARATYNGKDKRGQVNELKVHLPQVAVSHEQTWKPLPGGLRAQSERFTWQGEAPRHVQGRFTLDASGVDALLPFVISSSILRGVAKALVNLGETRAVVELDRNPSAVELRLEEARSGELRVFGFLRSEKDQEDACGIFYIDDPKFGIGIHLHRGETTIKPFVSESWWRDSPAVTTCGPDFAKRKPRQSSVKPP